MCIGLYKLVDASVSSQSQESDSSIVLVSLRPKEKKIFLNHPGATEKLMPSKTLVAIGTVIIITIIIVLLSPDVFPTIIRSLHADINSSFYRVTTSTHLESSNIDLKANFFKQITPQEKKKIMQKSAISLSFV